MTRALFVLFVLSLTSCAKPSEEAKTLCGRIKSHISDETWTFKNTQGYLFAIRSTYLFIFEDNYSHEFQQASDGNFDADDSCHLVIQGGRIIKVNEN